MLAAVFQGNKVVELKNFPKPEPLDNMVVVQVKSSCICGSDLKRYVLPEGSRGTIVGHEGAGQVVGTDKARYLRIGDRVSLWARDVCGHCYWCRSGIGGNFCPELKCMGYTPGFHGVDAEYVLIPERCCFPLPDDLSYDIGALLGDGLGTPYRAIKQAKLSLTDTVAILGLGPVGLGCVLLAKFLGARVIGVEINEFRIELAKKLGADCCINPEKEDARKAIFDTTKGYGADVCINCTAAESTFNLALDSTRNQGRAVMLAAPSQVTIKPQQFISKELKAIGSLYYSDGEYWEMLDLIERGLQIEPLITHHFPLKDINQAFATFYGGNTGKVVIHPEVT